MSSHSDALIAEFTDARRTYERLTDSMTAIISSLLAHHKITPVTIEKRTKTIDSFRGKIDRPEKKDKYKKINDITDLSGIRIIAYLPEERDKIFEIIQRNFDIDEENSVDKGQFSEADRFGYQSLHLIVSFDGRRLALEEFSAFQGLKAEIQIRTALQHAWASIDWGLRYKSHIGLPLEVRRALFRISALLETADVEFSRLYKIAESLRIEYEQKSEVGDLDIPVNVESLRAFFKKERPGIKFLRTTIEKFGGTVDSFPSDLSNYDFSRIVDLSKSLNIETLRSFEEALGRENKNFSTIIEKFKKFVDITGSYSLGFSADSAIFLRLLSELPPSVALNGAVNMIRSKELRGFIVRSFEEMGT